MIAAALLKDRAEVEVRPSRTGRRFGGRAETPGMVGEGQHSCVEY